MAQERRAPAAYSNNLVGPVCLAGLPSDAVCCLAQLFLTDPEAVLAEAIVLDAADIDSHDRPGAALDYLMDRQGDRFAGLFIYPRPSGELLFWLAPLVQQLGDILLLTLAALVIVNSSRWRLQASTPTARIRASRDVVDARLAWLLTATNTTIPTQSLADRRKAALLVQLFIHNDRSRIDAEDVGRLLTHRLPILVDQLPYAALIQQERKLRELWEKYLVSLDLDRLDVQLDAPLGGPRPDTEEWMERNARRGLVIVPAMYLPLPADRSDVLSPGEEWPLFICHDEFQRRFTRPGAADALQLANLLITDAHAYTVTRLTALLECIDEHIGHRKPKITIRGCPDLLAMTQPREPALLAIRHLFTVPTRTCDILGPALPFLASRPVTAKNHAKVVGTDWDAPPADAKRMWVFSESSLQTKLAIEGKRTEPGGGTIVRLTYLAHQLVGAGPHELHVTQKQLDVAFTQDELAMLVYLMQQAPISVTVHAAEPMAGSRSPDHIDMVQYYVRRVQDDKRSPVHTMYWNIWDR